jgi:ferric-dicitrate binding protein FerR (iron transport regulator)
MNNFFRYFEDEKFVHWVYNPDQEGNDYWSSWFTTHPEDRKDAEFAQLILLQLKSKGEKGNKNDAAAIYSEIIEKLSKSDRQNSWRRLILPFTRYAAVAILFLSLGAFLTYTITKKQDFEFDQSMNTVLGNAESQLILSDGRKIALHAKESSVEYVKAGTIVIDQTDTIESRSQKLETEMNQLIIPFGKNSSIILPDGTVAHLNAGSRLMYPSVFRGKNREVFLLGEGYFEVSPQPEKPFVVKTNDLSIVAIGTVFNVSAYPTDKIIETVLVKGQVVLRDNSFHIFQKDFVLKPGELAAFNRETLETLNRRVDVTDYVAWHEGFLNFQSVDLSRIILRLERYYNIKLILENPMMGTRSITGKLVLKEDKNLVLEVLASTARVELFKINESTYGLK